MTLETDVFAAFRARMELVNSISDSQWELIKGAISIKNYEKGQLLLTAGKYSGSVWFIFRGLVRNFYLTPEGKEFNKSFITAPGFCGAMTEMLAGQPSRFSISALEPTTTIMIPIEWFNTAKQSIEVLQLMELRLAQQLALKKEQREAELLLDDAKTRYLLFKKDHPELEARVPAYHIASYLGITEVALSRIKRQLNKPG